MSIVKRARFIYNKGRGKRGAKTNENEVWEVHQMKSARSFKEFEALNGISMEEVLTVFEAVSEAFPMIVAANLTKNTYTMICVKLYQKGRGDRYQWVSTHVIRVRDKDGDVCHVCINKFLDECSSCGEQQRVCRAPY